MRKKNGNNRSKRYAPIVISMALALVCLVHTEDAEAFCRTSSCAGGVTGARCTPAQPTDCGIELFWKNPCVGFSMQADASKQVDLSVATNIFEEAFATWANADCDNGTHPRISAVNLGAVECDAHEYNKDAGNANIILFQDTTWPHAGANSTLGLTTVTYNIDTGEIYDADMELNSANVLFTTDDKAVQFDLASIATHETGHFLGLSHSPIASATMFSDYTPGSTTLRTLDQDDVDGICAAYPPGSAIPSSCNSTPRRGLASICSPPPITKDDSSCSVAFGKTSAPLPLTALSIVAALGWFTKRRRARKHP